MGLSTRALRIVLCAALLAACTSSAAVDPTVAPSATAILPSPTVAPSATAAPTAAPPSPTATATARAAAALVYGADGGLSATLPEGGIGAGLDGLPPGLNPTLMAVAPDGGALAYVRDGRATVRDLRTGRDEDITLPGLDALPGGEPLTGFRWSPDSRTVLYDIERGSSVEDPRPVIVAAARGAMARALGPGMGPAWSPDGRAIAYAGPPFEGSPPSGGGQGGQLTVAGAALENPRALALAEAVHPMYQPILWSPEGGRVAAATAVFDAATGRPERIIPSGEREHIAAILHLGGPGEPIGLWRNLRTPDPADPGSLFGSHAFISVAPDGTETTLAATPPSLCPCLPTARPDVAWSRDGASLLVVGELDGMETSGVWLVGDGGQSHLNLTPTASSGSFLGVLLPSPDGRYALLTESRGRAPVTWAIPLTGGPERPVELGAGWAVGWQR